MDVLDEGEYPERARRATAKPSPELLVRDATAGTHNAPKREPVPVRSGPADPSRAHPTIPRRCP